MEGDCAEFVAMCLHCLTGKTGHKIPRPLSMTLLGTKPNEVIHFDFLYMGHGIDGLKYILVIRDDISSYLWLIPTGKADAEAAADGLARWVRVFTVMIIWVSDQGSHFKNIVMKELADVHKIKHHFTVAYSPWTNGTVESCMKDIQAANRCLQSELKLGPQDRLLITGMIQTSLNEAPLARLGTRGDGTYHTPLKVITGLKPARAMLQTSQIGEAQCEVKNIEKPKAMQMLDIDGLQRVFEEMHKYVAEKVTKNRARQIKHYNKKTNLIVPEFGLGDFVLVRRAQNKGHKQSFRWVGPWRVVNVIGELVYDVENVITNEMERVHASRLLTYRADFDGKVVSPDLLKHIAHRETKYELVGG